MTVHFSRAVRVVRHIFSLFFLFLIPAGLLSCGQGPQVASSTGRYLLVSNSSGIYSFSIQSNNTLSPVSSSAQQSASGINGMVYVKTPGGTSAPTLYAINGGSSIYYFPVSAGSVGAKATLNLTSCTSLSLSNLDAITATPGGHFLLVAYGSSSPYHVVAIALSGQAQATSCTSSPLQITSAPTGIAVDCAVSPGSPCNVLLSFATSAPEFSQWTENTNTFATASTLSNISTTPPYTLFSLSTTYFYLFSPSKSVVSSLSGSLTATSSPISSQSISINTSNPCLDLLANNLYLPTTNGSIYQMNIQSNGSMGGANQLWNLGDTPSLNSIGTCAVEE